jgi:hypothetical protein
MGNAKRAELAAGNYRRPTQREGAANTTSKYQQAQTPQRAHKNHLASPAVADARPAQRNNGSAGAQNGAPANRGMEKPAPKERQKKSPRHLVIENKARPSHATKPITHRLAEDAETVRRTRTLGHNS